MEHVVADITENQPGKHGRSKAAENQKEQTIEKKRERDAYDWRHNEPSRIVGIIVMNTMDAYSAIVFPNESSVRNEIRTGE